MVKIPEERIGSLRGEKGTVKKKIEERTDTKIEINGNTVEISGSKGLKLLTAKRIIKAIGRGFDPEIALTLDRPKMKFALIGVDKYAKTENSQRRLKGRVIGRDGEIKKKIEDTAKVFISVYGKTIGIIGRSINVSVARETIIKLLEGCEHSTALRFLNKKLGELNREYRRKF